MWKVEERNDEKGGVPMVRVPAGKFLMGSTPEHVMEMNIPHCTDCFINELPQHEVEIAQDFWIDQFPVTNAAYQKFIEDGGYTTERYRTQAGWAWVNRDPQKPTRAPTDYPYQARLC